MTIKLVVLESPYAGEIDENRQYAQRAARRCSLDNEAVIASHLLFPQFLDEHVPSERELGIMLGLAWAIKSDYSVFFTDRGWSRGMLQALKWCLSNERDYKIRSLDKPILLPTNGPSVELFKANIDMEIGIKK